MKAGHCARVIRWALGAFGPDWFPFGRRSLIPSEGMRSRGKDDPPPMSVATVRNERGECRHFTVSEEAFGAMLREPHPTRTLTL